MSKIIHDNLCLLTAIHVKKTQYRPFMSTNNYMKHYNSALLIIVLASLLASCSSDDYLKVVPADCQALAAIDMTMSDNKSDANSRAAELMKTVFGADDLTDCGIAFDTRILLFETEDGLFGLCAKVDDGSDLQTFIDDKLTAKGICQKTVSRKDCHFTMIRDSWLLGFTDEALLVIGPVVSTAKAVLIHQMTRLLEGKEKRSVVDSRIYHRLDSIQSPIALVTQARALPEQFAALFTLGAPKDADPSQLYLSLAATKDGSVVDVEWETFSFNSHIQAALQEAHKTFRPVTTRYLSAFTPDMPATILMNIDGGRLLEMMRDNKGLQTLLAGVNTAIDMDNILRCVDGDLSVFLPSFTEKGADVVMAAELKSTDFLKDVAYWKQSCPAGTRIEDSGPGRYRFTDGSMNFFFGVSDHQFYAGSTPDNCTLGLKSIVEPSSDISSRVGGQRLCLLVHLDTLRHHPTVGGMVEPILQLLFGDAGLLICHTVYLSP